MSMDSFARAQKAKPGKDDGSLYKRRIVSFAVPFQNKKALRI